VYDARSSTPIDDGDCAVLASGLHRRSQAILGDPSMDADDLDTLVQAGIRPRRHPRKNPSPDSAVIAQITEARRAALGHARSDMSAARRGRTSAGIEDH
jgi:hypothetical protein